MTDLDKVIATGREATRKLKDAEASRRKAADDTLIQMIESECAVALDDILTALEQHPCCGKATPCAAVPEGFAALVDAADNAYDSAEGAAYVEFYRREPVEKLLSACRAMLAAAKGVDK